ncbi:MAG: hypothetical protein RIQ75_1202 [Pseudomonadota bacterium]
MYIKHHRSGRARKWDFHTRPQAPRLNKLEAQKQPDRRPKASSRPQEAQERVTSAETPRGHAPEHQEPPAARRTSRRRQEQPDRRPKASSRPQEAQAGPSCDTP